MSATGFDGSFAPSFYPNPQTGRKLAYHYQSGKGPTLVFLSGFKSNMQGIKATTVEDYARAQGYASLRFDYSGHGQSEGAFEEGTIGEWLSDALTIIDLVAGKEFFLIGSSMGGWMALMVALARPEKVKGLIGLAPAPDFTERLIWQQATPQQQEEITTQGKIILPSCYGDEGYTITHKLIEEGRNHLLLHRESLPIHCPVWLIHGMADADVPWTLSTEIAQKVAYEKVRVELLKEGDHRLSKPEELELLKRTLTEALAQER
jgi:pimeloyl-ACP methyl ester carboxylesterase